MSYPSVASHRTSFPALDRVNLSYVRCLPGSVFANLKAVSGTGLQQYRSRNMWTVSSNMRFPVVLLLWFLTVHTFEGTQHALLSFDVEQVFTHSFVGSAPLRPVCVIHWLFVFTAEAQACSLEGVAYVVGATVSPVKCVTCTCVGQSFRCANSCNVDEPTRQARINQVEPRPTQVEDLSPTPTGEYRASCCAVL